MAFDPERYADRYQRAAAERLLEAHAREGVPGYLGIRFVEVGPGTVTAEFDLRPELLNPFGAAHGATLAAIVDHVLGTAVFTIVEPGTWPASLECKLNYLAPAREGVVRARSEVVAITTRTAVVAIECTNGDRLVGTALGTVALVAPRAAP